MWSFYLSKTRTSEQQSAEPKSDEPTINRTVAEGVLDVQQAVGNQAAEQSIDQARKTPGGDAGEQIPEEVREPLERSLGENLSEVRVHTGALAAESARALDAEAYTKGRDVYFAAGKYAPETQEGRRLLTHELAHTIQQRDAGAHHSGETPLEAEAEAAATHVSTGALQSTFSVTGRVGGSLVQRQKTPGAAESASISLFPTDSITLDHFASDKAELTPEHEQQLTKLAEAILSLLRSYPDTFISIIGHTDATAGELHNKTLGRQRAEQVRSALVNRGVPGEILRAASLGESALLVETQHPEPRNRRVEINIFKRSFFAAQPPAAPGREAPREAPPIPAPLPRVPIPRPPEETPDDIAKRNEEIWKKAQEIKKQREEEQKRPGTSLAEKLEKFVDQQMKKLGLPEFLRDKIKDLASEALEKGMEKALEELSADTALSEQQKGIIGKLLESVIKAK